MTVTATILGCGSSGGVPRVGNDWGDCDPGEPKNQRLRCAMLVEKRVDDKCTTVLIDTGPDLRQQLLAANVQNIDAVLYTHAHADHVHGIDDLRGFWVRNGKKTNVFMDLETYERVYSAFSYCFETPKGSNYPPILEHQPIQIGKPIEITGAGGTLNFEPIEVIHGEINALGFKTSGLAYVPDVSDIPENSEKALKDLNILVLDCLRKRPHPSHFCLQDSLEWTDRLAPKRAVFTNLHNDLDYATLRAELPATIEPAYDGLQLVLEETHDDIVLSDYAS